jgi:hypothetical protein
VRTCEGDDASIRFTFVYPRFAEKHASLRAVNAALKANIQGFEELDPCVAVAPLPIPSTGEEGVEEECAATTWEKSLLSVQCERAAWEGGRASGLTWFMNFDPQSGRELLMSEIVTDQPGFAAALRTQLLAENGAVFDDDEEFLSEVTESIISSCGFTPKNVTCSTLIRTHGFFKVVTPRARLREMLSHRYVHDREALPH